MENKSQTGVSRGVVLLSGGMDSLVTAAVALRDQNEVYFLHANYGQRTEAREARCFDELCRHYNPCGSLTLDWGWLARMGGSALTDPEAQIPSQADNHGVPSTYVPFRNATLLSAAVAWAEALNAGAVYIGAVEEDSSGYPDCREEFFNAFQQAIDTGTKGEFSIRIITPVLHLNKAEIVKLGKELEAPFHLSWSCYQDNDLACGECASCRLRLRAFAEVGLADPIPYRGKG